MKTLYESSTFTQLGKTVGSALNPLSANVHVEEDVKPRSGSSKKSRPATPGSESIFDALADACNAVHGKDEKGKRHGKSFDDASTAARRDTLFDQVIKGCSLLSSPVGEEFSDEDTFKTRTEDDDMSYYSEGESFGTMDDDYSSPRHNSRRSKRRNRRH